MSHVLDKDFSTRFTTKAHTYANAHIFIGSEYNMKSVHLIAAEFNKDQYPIATVYGI